MNKTLLKQALRFKDGNPTYSQVETLCKAVQPYQSENEVFFLSAKRGSRAEILDYEKFFEFMTTEALDGHIVESFEDIEKVLNARTRQENIEATGDSKSSYIRVFDQVVVYQFNSDRPMLYTNPIDIDVYGKILAVENGETFLNIYKLGQKYGFKHFVYLGGFSNSVTREFLRDKDVVFYLDYDIEAIRIYDSFECRSKSFYRHPLVEEYFGDKKKRNKHLYLKQRRALPECHSELQWLIDLIKEYSAVVEQEVFAE
jgi:hypothetical protein